MPTDCGVAPELSNRAIARMLGVSPTTVGSVRRELADKTVQSGQMDTGAYDWTKHPYLRENPDILMGLSERSLRAVKSPGVLDKMDEIGSRSPRYCQGCCTWSVLRQIKTPPLR